MSWMAHHTESEFLASSAEMEMRAGNTRVAIALYIRAAEQELQALGDLDESKIRTLSITAVSAVSLLFKAQQFKESQMIAHQWLGKGILLPFAVNQLSELVQSNRTEQMLREASVKFTRGEVFISVRGGEVVFGGAPLELIYRKVDEVRNLFYRTIEFMLEMPLRIKGSPSIEIQQHCRPWLFHAPPGSYQFAVRVQKPDQLVLPEFGDVTPKIEDVTSQFLQIVRATSENPQEALEDVVPDEDYRNTFVKLARNLAPPKNGKSFSQIDIRSAASMDEPAISFVSTSREQLNTALRASRNNQQSDADAAQPQISGVLRGLQLDSDWIEIVDDNSVTQRIRGARKNLDDIIGPMVNHRVTADVKGKGKSRTLLDIQMED